MEINSRHCYGCMEEKAEEMKWLYCGYISSTAPELVLHLPPGTVLQEIFQFGQALGRVSFGITYLAWVRDLSA